jgi:hypothetical protein
MFTLVVWTQFISSFNFIWSSYLFPRGFTTEIQCSLTCSVLSNLYGWSVLAVHTTKQTSCLCNYFIFSLYISYQNVFALFLELDIFGLHNKYFYMISLAVFMSWFFQKFCFKKRLCTCCVSFSALPEVRKQQWKQEQEMMSVDSQFPFLTSCQLQKSLLLQVKSSCWPEVILVPLSTNLNNSECNTLCSKCFCSS